LVSRISENKLEQQETKYYYNMKSKIFTMIFFREGELVFHVLAHTIV
jgi:hypothetical protein